MATRQCGLNSRFTSGQRSVDAAGFGTLPGRDAVNQESAPARAAGSAGHLTQAGLLTALGPQISARSDIFGGRVTPTDQIPIPRSADVLKSPPPAFHPFHRPISANRPDF